MDLAEIMISAANELKYYIDKENERLKGEMKCYDSDPPEYHDYQTCYELNQIAKKIKANNDTITTSKSAGV